MGNKLHRAVRNGESAAAEAAVSSSECLPKSVAEKFKSYACVVRYLSYVEDAAIWAKELPEFEVLWKQALLQQLLASGPSTHLHVLQDGIVGLVANAAVNIMSLISRKAESAPIDVLECETACAVVQGLLENICQLLDAEMLSKPQWVCGVHQQLLQQLAASGVWLVCDTLLKSCAVIASSISSLSYTTQKLLSKGHIITLVGGYTNGSEHATTNKCLLQQQLLQLAAGPDVAIGRNTGKQLQNNSFLNDRMSRIHSKAEQLHTCCA